jgi:hypothetical protein
MKKGIIGLAICCAAMITMPSCKKEYNEYYEVVPSKVMIYKASSSQWVGSGNRLYIDFNIPELTKYFMDQGIVSVAMSADNESTYNAIPAVIDAKSYSYDYMLGSVRVYLEDPIMEDGIVVLPPDNCIFKIGLTNADFIE